MDALIFVDTNILLDFYRAPSGAGGLELLNLIETHKDILITGSQVEMEYKRNRQREILKALIAQKTPDWSGLSSPPFLATAKPSKVIAKSKKTITAQQAKLKKRISSILDNPSAIIRSSKLCHAFSVTAAPTT
jgi:predicted nucleic acid-binding protein